MTQTRWLRRGLVLGIILGAVTFVVAAPGGPGPNLAVQPAVIDVHLMLNQAGSAASGNLTNTGDASASVMAIVPDSSCSASGVSGFASPSTPFTIAAFTGTHTVGLGCSSSGYGIRRCQQHINGTAETFASYTGLCITEGTTMFATTMSAVLFPNTQVGQTSATQTISITNPPGNPQSTLLSIQLGDQDGNFKVGAPCLMDGPGCDAPVIVPPSSSFSVSVSCSPQSVGPHTAMLYVVGSAGTKLMPPVSLSCTGTNVAGNPALSVNPASVTLTQEIGKPPAQSMVHIGNIGGADLHVTSLTLAGSTDWSYSLNAPCVGLPCTLTGGMSFDITTIFAPTAIGTRNATLTISSDDPNAPMYQLQLNGTGQGATLALASNLGVPPTLDLGTSPIGIQTTATFDLRNDGNILLAPVNLALAQAGSELTVMPNPTTIAAAGMRQITVGCTPTASTVYMATLDITAPGATSGSPISIMVRCTGTAGNLYSTPSSVQLGEIRTGSPLVTRTIMLKTAGGSLSITSPPALAPTVAGMMVGVPTAGTITLAAPASFDLTVDPVADHDLTTSIAVTAGGDSLAIPVTGKVVTAKIEHPASIMVGSFCVGQSTTGAAARLTATGTATIGLASQPVMNKMSSSPFQLSYTSPVSYPYQLPANQTAMVEVTPLRQMIKGTQTDELVWTTDVAGELAPRTTVTAEFVADGGAIAPQLADFGAVKLRDTGEPKVIKIQNCGMEAMTLAGPFFAPEGEFRDDSAAPLPETLEPNQIATINVNFVPKKLGTRMATLTVESSKGTLSVALLGQGVADPDKTVDAKSFYACDCKTSDPTSAWPALLVFVVLRRRRRR